MKKIILISPFPPAQNPRLLKEYQALKAKGFKVTVFYGVRDKWATNFSNYNNDFKLIGGDYKSFIYYFTNLLHKLSIYFLPLEFSYHRVSLLLYIKLLTTKADLYIAHNLAALPIAVKAAKMHKAKCGFDAEDFHRQEISDDINSKTYTKAKALEDKYLKYLDYFIVSSPLISTAYKKLYPKLNPLVIVNAFQKKSIKNSDEKNHDNLSLFWFSQKIGRNRGLDQVFKALKLLDNKKIKLGLLGMINASDKEYFINLARENNLSVDQLIFINPVAPDKIFEIASKHDIGLALEPGFCLNNDIALSNKLFTYLCSSLAIIATSTSAQRAFLNEYTQVGKCFHINDIKELAAIIQFYFDNAAVLLQSKQYATKLANEKLNWETESIKFIDIVKNTLES